ncbi:MAG: GntR family transcriptional regulator [Sedimentisphaeraceae bacterium JB056]
MDTLIKYNNKTNKVAYSILEDIKLGQYPPGRFLPVENTLADKYNTSRITIRKVLGILETAGVVEKVPYKGVFVKEDCDLVNDQEQKNNSISNQITIGVIFAGTDDSLIVNIKDGIRMYSESNNITAQFFASPNGHDVALETLRNIPDMSMSGIIIFPHPMPEYKSLLKQLADKNYPIVCIDRHFEDISISSVESDNSGGAYIATQYLIEKYHQPVYFLGHSCGEESCTSRISGYKLAMQHSGFGSKLNKYIRQSNIKSDDTAYWPLEKKTLSNLSIAEELLDNCKFPASIFCVNDYAAASLYEIAKSKNIEVGKDIHVIGFDDAPIAKLLEPGLTTIRQNPNKMGQEAARLLHDTISTNLKNPINISLPVELITRGSA